MKLSITQRITITVALISGAIFAVIGAVFFLSLEWSIKAKGQEKAQAFAVAVDSALLKRIDEDILVDFAGEGIHFDRLSIPYDHWAVIRKNGHLERARGIFEVNPFIAQSALDPSIKIPDMKEFKLASVPFVTESHIQWTDLPEIIRQTVRATVSREGTFLNVENEVAGDRNGFGVKWLYSDHILELTIADTGELVEIEIVDLPRQLPEGMEIYTTSNELLDQTRITGWQTCEGELIALVQGRLDNGQTAQMAVNRLGESFNIESDGRIQGRHSDSRLWVVAAYDLEKDLAQNRSSGYAIVLGGSVMWFLIVLVAWLVTRHSLRRVDQIIGQVQRINPAQMDERLSVGQTEDELARLSRTVNKMLDRIQDGYEREQQFTGDVSHELRNPLAKIIAEIEWISSKPRQQTEYEQTLSRLKSYGENMQSLIESLLLLSRLEDRSQDFKMESFDLVDLMMELLKPLPSDQAQRIRLEFPNGKQPLRSMGHRQLVGVLLRNLVDNALRYSPLNSPVTLRIHRNCQVIHVEVEDTGQGIPPRQIQDVFHRFYRVEKSRSKQTGGVGLGLSIVKAIADLHQTTITLKTGLFFDL